MNLKTLFAKIMGFLIIIVTLALAPSINTANATVAALASVTNASSKLLGMSVVTTFGAPLIIIGLLVAGGMFSLAGIKNELSGAGMKEMMGVIGSVILVIVALTFMVNIIAYDVILIEASSGFAQTIYGIIPLIIYLGTIAIAGWTTVSTYRRARKHRRSATAYGY